MKIAVVIPAHNEETRIGKVLDDLKKTNLFVCVVDDGSKDKTFQVASKKASLALKHRINLGKGAALKTGCEAVFKLGYDAVVIMDSDGQHLVGDLNKFIELIKTRKFDVIFGRRKYNKGIPIVRYWGNKVASILVWSLFKIYISDLICGYRAFTRKSYKKLKWQSSGYGVETEMVIRVGLNKLRYAEIPVQNVYHDKFKGVTVFDALSILFQVVRWRFIR